MGWARAEAAAPHAAGAVVGVEAISRHEHEASVGRLCDGPIQKNTRYGIRECSGGYPSTRPNISESHSEISTRVPFVLLARAKGASPCLRDGALVEASAVDTLPRTIPSRNEMNGVSEVLCRIQPKTAPDFAPVFSVNLGASVGKMHNFIFSSWVLHGFPPRTKLWRGFGLDAR